MIRLLFALFYTFATATVYAEGPLFRHKDRLVAQEFENVYKDVRGAGGISSDDLLDQLQVIQYKYGSTTTTTSTTNTTFTDTNLTVSITPTSASNKILVFASGTLYHTAAGFSGAATIARNGNNIGGSHGMSEINTEADNTVVPSTMMVLDSPNTTDATVYRVRIKTVSGGGSTGWINGNVQFSTIIAIEVKG